VPRLVTCFLAAGLCLSAFGSQVFGQLPAQRGRPGTGQRPTSPPAGRAVAEEPSHAAAGTLRSRSGGNGKAYAAIADASYMIGVRGYGDGDGIVVTSTLQRRDYNQGGRTRSPAMEILVDFQGNGRLVKIRLESGDKITGIDGFQVTNLQELIVAVNSAGDPHRLEIAFIDWRSGNEYVGTINAMRVR
jgi:hypothetical protein